MLTKIFLMIVFIGSINQLFAQNTLLNLDANGIIIDGYDVIAFFNEGKPVKGDPQYQTKYNGSVYLFSSAENKKQFELDPKKHEVQFGGFCAYAVSQGHVSPIDPNFCVIQKDAQGVDRLICQHNQKASDLWNKSPDKLMMDAFKYWPAVEKSGGKQIDVKGVEHFFINIDNSGLANQGYDVVAYHTESKAVRGDSRFTEWYHGAKYIFKSKENQGLFRSNPREYIPQYGGFCAYAMSFGKIRPVDPTIFSIENGRLMLQHTQDAYVKFTKDVEGNIKKADERWPGVERKHAGGKIKFDKPAK